MTKAKTKPDDLREACLQEALRIIETSGVERLSLRDVARRLNVSHQAPYKHFESRDHILAEIVARAYASFAAALDARPQTDDPEADLAEMGKAYVRYAQTHPLQYRLMFGTPLPDPKEHRHMLEQARHAFSLLTNGLKRKARHLGQTKTEEDIQMDALFIWSTLHGLASLLKADALSTLDLPAGSAQSAPLHILSRLKAGLEVD